MNEPMKLNQEKLENMDMNVLLTRFSNLNYDTSFELLVRNVGAEMGVKYGAEKPLSEVQITDDNLRVINDAIGHEESLYKEITNQSRVTHLNNLKALVSAIKDDHKDYGTIASLCGVNLTQDRKTAIAPELLKNTGRGSSLV